MAGGGTLEQSARPFTATRKILSWLAARGEGWWASFCHGGREDEGRDQSGAGRDQPLRGQAPLMRSAPQLRAFQGITKTEATKIEQMRGGGHPVNRVLFDRQPPQDGQVILIQG